MPVPEYSLHFAITPLIFLMNFLMYSLFFSVGPLLPENHDVRNIPIKKRRQLTMALSGKILNNVNAYVFLLDSLSTAHPLPKGTSVSTR